MSEEVKNEIKKIAQVIEDGYAGMLTGGIIVDIREHPEARPCHGDAGRNARKPTNHS